MLDRLGIPRGDLVLGQQLFLNLRRADIPRGLGVINQVGITAPAVRVGVPVHLQAE